MYVYIIQPYSYRRYRYIGDLHLEDFEGALKSIQVTSTRAGILEKVKRLTSQQNLTRSTSA